MNPFFNKYYGVESKNRGPFLAFSQDWFYRWQHWLLFLLNAPILKLWSRWILRIHRDCKYCDPIIEIQPDNYRVQLKDGQIRGDFRTHPKFSKRIYFAFRWWWWTLHYLDEAFKPAWMPDISFGFDTLTSYPSASNVSPCDGYTRRSGVTEYYNAICSGAGTYANYSLTSAELYSLTASNVSNKFSSQVRGFFNFNTNIGSSYVVSAVTISFYGSGKGNSLGSPQLWINSAFPASTGTIAASDYGNVGWTLYGLLNYSGFTTGAYNNITLYTGANSYINKTGVTSFSTYSDWDYNATFGGTWVSSGTTYISARTADYTGTTYDPKLVVTYGAASNIKSIGGTAKAGVKTAAAVAIVSLKKIIGLA